jgi:RNA polymerase sigma factor FliA
VAKAGDAGELWLRYRATKDEALRDRLILTNAPLVKYVADRVATGLPTHLDKRELVSAGLRGLAGAVEHYQPDRDVEFETYAISTIRTMIVDELRRKELASSPIRAGARRIEGAMRDLARELGRAPTDKELAERLGISEERLEQSLTEISRSGIAALDELWTYAFPFAPDSTVSGD